MKTAHGEDSGRGGWGDDVMGVRRIGDAIDQLAGCCAVLMRGETLLLRRPRHLYASDYRLRPSSKILHFADGSG